jgi:hypothetical protein
MPTESKVVEDLVNRVVVELAPILAGRAPVPRSGFQCTGSRFACGQYRCPTTPGGHSCRDVFECNITFSEPPKLQI